MFAGDAESRVAGAGKFTAQNRRNLGGIAMPGAHQQWPCDTAQCKPRQPLIVAAVDVEHVGVQFGHHCAQPAGVVGEMQDPFHPPAQPESSYKRNPPCAGAAFQGFARTGTKPRSVSGGKQGAKIGERRSRGPCERPAGGQMQNF